MENQENAALAKKVKEEELAEKTMAPGAMNNTAVEYDSEAVADDMCTRLPHTTASCASSSCCSTKKPLRMNSEVHGMDTTLGQLLRL